MSQYQTIDMDLLNEQQKVAAKRAIQTVLYTAVVHISFIKADGTLREMMATLNPQAIAQCGGEDPSTREKRSDRPENIDVVHLFDFDNKQLRAFRMDRLVSVAAVNAKDLVKFVTSSI